MHCEIFCFWDQDLSGLKRTSALLFVCENIRPKFSAASSSVDPLQLIQHVSWKEKKTELRQKHGSKTLTTAASTLITTLLFSLPPLLLLLIMMMTIMINIPLLLLMFSIYTLLLFIFFVLCNLFLNGLVGRCTSDITWQIFECWIFEEKTNKKTKIGDPKFVYISLTISGQKVWTLPPKQDACELSLAGQTVTVLDHRNPIKQN